MVFASSGLSTIEWDSKNGCCQHLCPQGEFPLPAASIGGSSRSASGSDPDTFQNPASAMGLRACEILCIPFKSRVFVSCSLLALPNINPAGFQSQMLFSWNPGLASLMWGLDPLLLGKELCGCDMLPICG